jgi:uncharacterized repeat protein (TIGR03803 family)
MRGLLLRRWGVLFCAALLSGCAAARPPAVSPTASEAHPISEAAKNDYKIIHSFSGGADGQQPLSSLLYLNGKLYGTTEYGGNSACYYGCGTVFAATTSGKTRVVHRFAGTGKDGQLPEAGVIAVKGKLYGTTSAGGTPSGGAGTVYETTTSGQERVLYTFTGRGDGATPTDDLVETGGALYGTTKYGNSYHYTCQESSDGCGTVFSLTLSGKEKILHNFTTGLEDGYWPYAGLLFSKGELYGTTGYGGTAEDGTVFEVTPAGKERVLHSFSGGHDGYFAYSALTELKGEFYGTTTGGGAFGLGTVFAIDATGKERIVYAFKGGPNDGYLPEGRLVTVNGKLYGTTVIGGAFKCSASGAGCGTVFEVTPSGAESVLHSFKGHADGATPWAGLTLVNGMLYGTTGAGGTGNCSGISGSSGGCGTIFEIAP